MARPLRIQFEGAIYHVMARGNGRQRLFHEERDYQRMCEGLEKTVDRTGWEVLAFVWMPLVENPADWPWSSYVGYANRRKQTGYVAYQSMYAAWQGD